MCLKNVWHKYCLVECPSSNWWPNISSSSSSFSSSESDSGSFCSMQDSGSFCSYILQHGTSYSNSANPFWFHSINNKFYMCIQYLYTNIFELRMEVDWLSINCYFLCDSLVHKIDNLDLSMLFTVTIEAFQKIPVNLFPNIVEFTDWVPYSFNKTPWKKYLLCFESSEHEGLVILQQGVTIYLVYVFT